MALDVYSSNVYCPFCGVILFPDPYESDDPGPPQTRSRPWYAEVRGVYLTDSTGVGCISITGLGIVCARNILCAPSDSNLSYTDPEIETLEEWRIFSTSESRWCFGFHNSCWKLLLLRLEHVRRDFLDELTIAESVFYQLYCTPCRYGSSFEFGHDYDGAAQTQKPAGRFRPLDLTSHLYADPCAIPSADDLEATAPDIREAQDSSQFQGPTGTDEIVRRTVNINHSPEREVSTSSQFKPPDNQHLIVSCQDRRAEWRANQERPTPRTLDALSSEMKFQIFSYLSFAELLKMRLVCRDLAQLATLDTLPQSYWRNRFALDQEADFIFPSLRDTRRWSQLFFGTRKCLKVGLGPLVNRKRIRQLLEPIAALVEQQPGLPTSLYGTAFYPARGQCDRFPITDGQSTENLSDPMEITGSFAGLLTSVGAGTPLHEGCRVLYCRKQPLFPPSDSHQQRICISTVRIGARRFISGITLFSSGETSSLCHSLGYHNPSSQEWIEIPPTSQVRDICVAFRSEGLTGVKFIFTNSDYSCWIGDAHGPGIGCGTLRIPGNTGQYYLLAALDHFKIVSLGFGQLNDNPEVSPKVRSEDAVDSSCVHSYLWTLDPPMHENLTISNLLPSYPFRSFAPLMNIDFGGPKGLLLGTLTRFTFYMGSPRYPLVGIEICYSDSTCVLFGSNTGCGISIFVNGSKGERVKQISAVRCKEGIDSEICLGGLQISTNYGQTSTFAPLRRRLNPDLVHIPILPPSNTITGFVALQLRYENHVIGLGIQSQQCDTQPITEPDLDPHCHEIPEYELQYDRKFSHFINSSHPGNYQTYASLKHVKRIQASTGIQGRSRSPNRICGLKIDYHNHPSPGIVGQWMNELDDGFELSPDEEVRQLTIHLTPMGFSTESPGMEVGQVVAIYIETSRDRSVTFRSAGFDTLPPRKLHHQYQGDFDERLTAISWLLNLESDCVRAAVSGNGCRRATVLVPEQEPPFDQVRKLYFWKPNERGQRDTIVKVEASFRDQVIIGLAFVYTSGDRARMGDFDGNTHQTLNFAKESRIVVISAAVEDHQLMAIEFEVEGDEASGCESLKLSLNPRGPASTFRYTDTWRSVPCGDGTGPEGDQELFTNNRIYTAPRNSSLVGIYVGCQEFGRVGALYEPDVSERV